MYLLYADESGDSGLPGQSEYFIVSGIVIHENYWQSCYDALRKLREDIKNYYNVKLSEEIHTTSMFASRRKVNNDKLPSLPIKDKLQVIRWNLNTLANTKGFQVYSVVAKKDNYCGNQNDLFANVWKTFIQRFENTILKNNFQGSVSSSEHGILFVDKTRDELRTLLRQMRNYNPIPNKYGGGTRQCPIKSVIDDATMVDSKTSFFIQSADVLAYTTKQYLCPNKVFRRYKSQNLYKRLKPIQCTQIASEGIKIL